MACIVQNVEDLCNQHLAKIAAVLHAPETSKRKWDYLVDLVDELDWADAISRAHPEIPQVTPAEASPVGVSGAGFVGGGVGAPPTKKLAQSTNVLGGNAHMPAAANSASGSVPSREAIIEANRRAALATRAIKQAQAVAAVPASMSHSHLMSQLG